MTRFTSFVLLVTLAGTPAVAAACAWVCQPGAFHHATSATATANANHDEHSPDARDDASHEHVETAQMQAASGSPSASASLSLSFSASNHECCPIADGPSVQARYPAQRTDVSTTLSLSAAAHTRAPSLPAFVSVRPPPDLDPPGAYTPRSHAPLVLRI